MRQRTFCSGAVLLLALAGPAWSQPILQDVAPRVAATAVSPPVAIFDAAMAPATAAIFTVHGSCSGDRPGLYLGGGTPGLGFDPQAPWWPGERISCTLTTGLQDAGGVPLAAPYVWEFVAAPLPGPCTFSQITSWAGLDPTPAVDVGDVDGDGDLDVVLGTHSGQNLLLRNQGAGSFAPPELWGQTTPAWDLELGDLDHDGDLDVVVAIDRDVPPAAPTEVYLNDGTGTFSLGPLLGPGLETSTEVELGDLDGDGHLDVFVGNGGWNAVANACFFGDGLGGFGLPQYITDGFGMAVVDNTLGADLGDVNGDGALDLVLAGLGLTGFDPNLVYINDGTGHFDAASSFSYSPAGVWACSAGLADLDGDQDLDLVTAILGEECRVHINDGAGTFTPGPGFTTTGHHYWGLAFGDLDGDGDQDLVFGDNGHPTEHFLYTNDGAGHLTRGAHLPTPSEAIVHLALGDLDRDGDLDVVTADSQGTGPPAACLNGGLAAPRLHVAAGAFPPRPAGLAQDGQTDVVVLQLDVLARGGAGGLATLELVATGTGDDASGLLGVRLAAEDPATRNGTLDGGDQVLATGAYPADDGTWAVTLSPPLVLPAAQRVSLLVLYDLAPGASGPAPPATFAVTATNLGGTHPVVSGATTGVVEVRPPDCLTVLCGDCDGNGVVTITDALLGAQHAASLAALAGAAFSNCNVQGPLEPDPAAAVSILDALVIARAVVGRVATLGCCVP